MRLMQAPSQPMMVKQANGLLGKTPQQGQTEKASSSFLPSQGESSQPTRGLVLFGAHGPFLVVDGLPIGGGMGDITQSAIPAINALGHDLRPILPFRSGTANPAFGFQKTNVVLHTDRGPTGTPVDVEVWQSTKYRPGVVYYALKDRETASEKSGRFFAKQGNIYLDRPAEQKIADFFANPSDGFHKPKTFNSMFYSKMAGALSVLLNDPVPTEKAIGPIKVKLEEGEVPLKTFAEKADTIILNDWSSAPVADWLDQYGEDFNKHAKTYFFAHNLGYNNTAPTADVEWALELEEPLFTPEYDGQGRPMYNPMNSGLFHGTHGNGAGVFIDRHYAQFMVDAGKQYGSHTAALLEKAMHPEKNPDITGPLIHVTHGITPEDFLLADNQGLMSDRSVIGDKGPLKRKYTPLVNTMEELAELLKPENEAIAKKRINQTKIANKLAFQTEVGFTPNPGTPLFIWVNRMDPWQKGGWMLIQAMEELLGSEAGKPKENVQFAILGGSDDPYLNARLQDIVHRFPQNVFNYPAFNIPLAQRAYAAGDANIIGSIYEPFGIVQKKGAGAGTLAGPVSWVDGLRSSVIGKEKFNVFGKGVQRMAPPEYQELPDSDIKPYGIFMNPNKFPGFVQNGQRQYTQALSKFYDGAAMGQNTKLADDEFLRVMKQIIHMVKDRDQTEMSNYRYNAIKTAYDHQRWEPVAERYYHPALSAPLTPGTQLSASA